MLFMVCILSERVCPLGYRHIKTRNWHSKAEAKLRVDYHRRSLVETAMGRIKGLTGDKLSARSLPAQRAEVATRLMALNLVTNPAVQLRTD